MAKIMIEPFTIIIDQQEQKPYSFPNNTCIVKHLKTGDYSILGMEHLVTVERKSIADAYGTFGGGRERFKRELSRMAAMQSAMVVIESSLLNALEYKPMVKSRRKSNRVFTAKMFNRSFMSWMRKYKIPFLFCDNRALAQRETYIFLQQFYNDWKDR